MGDLGLHLCDQVVLGLLRREAGDALQHFGLAALDELDLLLLLIGGGVLLSQRLLFLFDHLGLVIEIFLFLLQTALLLLLLGAAFFHFPLVFAAVFQNLFFCFEKRFPLFILRAFNCLVDDARGFFHRRHSERGCCHDPTCCGHCSFLLCCDGLYGAAQDVP